MQKLMDDFKDDLRKQERIIRGYMKFKDSAGYLKPTGKKCCFNANYEPTEMVELLQEFVKSKAQFT